MDRYVREFASPDELIEIETVRSAMISKGGLTVSYDVHQPGWRWSTHVQPLVGGEWCQVHHVGVLLAGRLAVRLTDGTEFQAGRMSLIDVPSGHDAWVVGNEPVETITWTGAKGFLAPLETLTERVLRTLLFTDVVDSTGTAIRMGDRAWGDLLGTLEAQTNEVLARYRGQLIEPTGDGVLAMFDGAARALRCAVALRDVAAGLDLGLRLAVHTGEVEVAGDNIRGVAIHEASRILALAGPGEILVSATTVGLATDSGLAFDDRGEHELRGMSAARHLYAVR
jgi:class 3 adenylate cyclase